MDNKRLNKSVDNVISRSGKIYDKFSKKKSIIGMAKENVFEFPVFVADSVPLEYATATNSLIEQVYASYLQMAISIDPIVDTKDFETGRHLKKFKTDTNQYLEHTDMTYAHDACHNTIERDECIVEFDMTNLLDEDINVIVEHFNYEPLSEFNHYFQEAEKPDDDDDDEVKQYIKDDDDEVKEYIKNVLGSSTHATIEENKEKRRLEVALAKEKLAETKKKNENCDKEHKEDRTKSAESHTMSKEKHANDVKTKAPQFIDETKIQKLNTMKPLLMTVNVRVRDEKSGLSDKPIEYIIGVKTFARLIDADILPEVAKYPLKEMNKIKRKAKWRAGELKFFKDIIFKIKQKKQSAFDTRDKKRKWYRRLYELAHKENYQANIFKGKAEDGIPNATIIISQSDVINIKSQTGIDMFAGNNAVSFCKELFLMSLVVVDSDAESIKVLVPDLHDDFEIHSIASINKQLSTLDTSGTKTRDILKLFK